MGGNVAVLDLLEEPDENFHTLEKHHRIRAQYIK